MAFGQLVAQIAPRRPAFLLQALILLEDAVVIFAQTAWIQIDDRLKIFQTVANVEDFIHLLLITGHDKPRIAVVQNIGNLIAHRVLVNRHGHSANRLCRQHGPIQIRAVATRNRHVIPFFCTQREQTQGQGLHLLHRFTPGPALPNTKFFLAIGRFIAKLTRIACQECWNRDQIRRIRRSQNNILPMPVPGAFS